MIARARLHRVRDDLPPASWKERIGHAGARIGHLVGYVFHTLIRFSGPTSSQRPGMARSVAKAATVRQRAISLGDTTITYRHRVSRRARRLRFEVRPGNGLEVTTPPGISVARIEAVMREKTDWITKMLVRYAQPPLSVVETPLQSGALLPLRVATCAWSSKPRHPGRRKTTIMGEGDTAALSSLTDSPDAVQSGHRDAGTDVRRDMSSPNGWRTGMRNSATSFGRIAIRDQKSRWGSCSRQGNLNFNWRLLLAPLAVLDYIVIHELAHSKRVTIHRASGRWWLSSVQTIANIAPGCASMAPNSIFKVGAKVPGGESQSTIYINSLRLIRYVVSQSHAIAGRESRWASLPAFFRPALSRYALFALLPVTAVDAPYTSPVSPHRAFHPFAWPDFCKITPRGRRTLSIAVALCNKSATAHQRSCLGMVHSITHKSFTVHPLRRMVML